MHKYEFIGGFKCSIFTFSLSTTNYKCKRITFAVTLWSERLQASKLQLLLQWHRRSWGKRAKVICDFPTGWRFRRRTRPLCRHTPGGASLSFPSTRSLQFPALGCLAVRPHSHGNTPFFFCAFSPHAGWIPLMWIKVTRVDSSSAEQEKPLGRTHSRQLQTRSAHHPALAVLFFF